MADQRTPPPPETIPETRPAATDAPAAVPETSSSPTSAPTPATTGGVGFIEAEADEPPADDADSFFGSDVESSTASISSSILKYREENGRTYHAYKDGQYVLPNDVQEQERLDLQHHLTLLTFENQLYVSPAGRNGHKVHNVLDVGTGTGVWAVDFADEHPEAQVIGVDLSPIQSPFVPPNLSFQIDDIEEPWTFNVKFDFIYSRQMTSSLADWPRFFQQSYDNLSPGGWFEIVDICATASDDNTLPPDSALKRWVDLFIEGSTAIGRAFDHTKHYYREMEEAGFVNMQQVIYKWPTNPWPKDKALKELGMWNFENISGGLEGLSVAVFTRVLGWTKPELDVFLAQVLKDLRNPKIHAYFPIMVVYGQKPE